MQHRLDIFVGHVDDLVSSLVEEPALSRRRAGLEQLAAALLDAPDDSLVSLAGMAARAADAADADIRAALAHVEAAWNGWKAAAIARAAIGAPPGGCEDASTPRPIPTAEDDDEIAMLVADPELGAMFVAEAIDHLGSIEALALQLEAAPHDHHLLDDVFRPFHTIKGNAGALGIVSIQECAHSVENLLDLARSGKHSIGPPEIEVILQAVDVLTTMIRSAGARMTGQPGIDVTRERQAVIDAVAALIAGAPVAESVPRAPEPARATGPAGAVQQATDPAGERAPARTEDPLQASVKVDTRKLDALVDAVGELVIVQSMIQGDPVLRQAAGERLTRNLAQLERITTDLQRNAMSMRMTPIRPTFQKMSRLVRDLARKSSKSIELTLSGEDTELDRKVVEDINDPLMHMVRNSVDHGIEPAERRLAAGKPAQARVSLSAYHEGSSIVIAIADDGAGLDTDRIRAKAVAQGLVAADAALSEAEIHQLIFMPGFSTAETITEISGRGVGMDVVRRNIEALRGRIEIQTQRGAGTTFFIRLPLTLAILEGLLLRVGDERFVLPTFSVRESLRPAGDQVHSLQGRRQMIKVRESVLPLVHLDELFGREPAAREPCESTVVVIEDNGRRFGLVVDELLGKQEVVIKSLGEAFGAVRGVAGGAILGDGRIGLILDAGGLIALMERPVPRAA